MAAPYYSLISKTARALQCYVRDAAVDGLPLENIFDHRAIDQRVFPNVTFRVQNATPKRGNPGCWDVVVHCMVSTSVVTDNAADYDPILDSDNLVGRIFDLFLQSIVREDNSGLADAITAAARAASSYDGSDPELAAAALRYAFLADFKCDSIVHLGGIDIGVNEDNSAYVDTLPLLLTVRTSTATES